MFPFSRLDCAVAKLAEPVCVRLSVSREARLAPGVRLRRLLPADANGLRFSQSVLASDNSATATLMPNTTNHISGRDNLPAGMAGAVRLSDDVLDFIQSGVSVIVGVVGPDGRAQAGRALATRVVAGGGMRLMYPADGNAAITASARSGGPIAVTFSAPISHRTIQLKAGSSRLEQLEPEDRICLESQIDAFAGVLRAIGFPLSFVQAFCANRSVTVCVLSFLPQAAYEQTPGPGAGREL